MSWECSVVEKFFRIHLRHIRRLHNAYFVSKSENSIFKILIDWSFWRDDFENQFKIITTTKNVTKFDSKLNRWLGTYFSKEICQKINVRINYFFSFLINCEFVRRLLQILQISSFQYNSRKSTENIGEQWDITETNNWKILLIFSTCF